MRDTQKEHGYHSTSPWMSPAPSYHRPFACAVLSAWQLLSPSQPSSTHFSEFLSSLILAEKPSFSCHRKEGCLKFYSAQLWICVPYWPSYFYQLCYFLHSLVMGRVCSLQTQVWDTYKICVSLLCLGSVSIESLFSWGRSQLNHSRCIPSTPQQSRLCWRARWWQEGHWSLMSPSVAFIIPSLVDAVTMERSLVLVCELTQIRWLCDLCDILGLTRVIVWLLMPHRIVVNSERCLNSQSPACHVDTATLWGFPSSLGVLLPFCSEIPQVLPLGTLSLSPGPGAARTGLLVRAVTLTPPSQSFSAQPRGHFAGQQGTVQPLALHISSSKCFQLSREFCPTSWESPLKNAKADSWHQGISDTGGHGGPEEASHLGHPDGRGGPSRPEWSWRVEGPG